jgi:1D-myo-inositol 3-kinase
MLSAVSEPPALLVIGHVTRDDFGRETRLGGSAGYAAQAAVLLGLDVGLVTIARPDEPVIEPLRKLAQSRPVGTGAGRLRLAVARSECTTSFGIEYLETGRRLTLLERARPLTWADIPVEWRSAKSVFFGTVTADCDTRLPARFSGANVGAALQGWLRRSSLGRVEPVVLTETTLPDSLGAATFSESDHTDALGIAQRLAARGTVVALTEGRAGASLFWGRERAHVPPVEALEVDPTGAGDIFAFVFALSLWAGFEPPQAAARAALAAARVVEGPGLGRLELAAATLIA